MNEAHDGAEDYVAVYAEGGYYNIHWNSRLDWSHM